MKLRSSASPMVGTMRHGCDGRDALAELLVRNADDQTIDHGLVTLDRLFHFFGVDLLAGGIDALRAAAQKIERTVGFDRRPVAGEGVAHAVDRLEGRGALLLVFVVADRPRLPPAATIPVSPEPGSTRRPSSVKTFVVGAMANLAVSPRFPRVVIWLPIEPSLEPIASKRMKSPHSRSCAFTSVVHMTPEDTRSLTGEVSYGVPASLASSSAFTMGRLNASPTMTT